MGWWCRSGEGNGGVIVGGVEEGGDSAGVIASG